MPDVDDKPESESESESVPEGLVLHIQCDTGSKDRLSTIWVILFVPLGLFCTAHQVRR